MYSIFLNVFERMYMYIFFPFFLSREVEELQSHLTRKLTESVRYSVYHLLCTVLYRTSGQVHVTVIELQIKYF